MSTTDLIEALEQEVVRYQDEGNECAAEAVRDILDRLVGWCSPHQKIVIND